MRDKIIVIVFFVFQINALSQKMPEDFLYEGNNYFYQDSFNLALDCYRYICENYTWSDVYPLALFNMAKTYDGLDLYDSSIVIYDKIIKSSFDNSLQIATVSIMDNPYANFSFKACLNIAGIYSDKGQFLQALSYYFLADTSEIFVTFCSNENAEVNYLLKEKIATCYLKLNMNNKAITILAKEIFGSIFASNKKLVALLISILDENYERNEIEARLEKSINGVYLKGAGYCIKLFGQEIEIYDSQDNFQKDITLDKAKEIVKNNKLFKHYLN